MVRLTLVGAAEFGLPSTVGFARPLDQCATCLEVRRSEFRTSGLATSGAAPA